MNLLPFLALLASLAAALGMGLFSFHMEAPWWVSVVVGFSVFLLAHEIRVGGQGMCE